MNITTENLIVAIMAAAAEAYRVELIDTELEATFIGPGKRWENKEEWVDARIQEWLGSKAQWPRRPKRTLKALWVYYRTGYVDGNLSDLPDPAAHLSKKPFTGKEGGVPV